MNLPFLLLILGVSQKENQQWEDYKITYNKKYESLQEELTRRAIFLRNYKEIDRHNQNFEQGLESFAKGVNEFSDMETEEFEKRFQSDSDNVESSDEQDEDPNPFSDLEQDALMFEVEQRWNEFKMTHEKEYKRFGEEMNRKGIFKRNLQMIKQHNERFYQGLETFYMGVNQFTDLTTEEFTDTYLNFQPLNTTVYETVEESWIEFSEEEQVPLTKTSSWYTERIPIKNQGSCGSCWAFSVTGVLEYAYYFFKNNKIVSLSEQELVDCDHKSHGCNGGIPYYTLQWVQQNGINFEKDYPYEKHQASCRRKRSNVGPSIIKNVGYTRGGEKEMLEKLQNIGPIQVAVNADHWQHYQGGYFVPQNCNGRSPNHAVVVIAAVKDKGKDMWLFRNSWGAHWGIKGHAKAVMFQNSCNIAQAPGSFINH